MKVTIDTLMATVSLAVFLCGFGSPVIGQSTQANQDPDLKPIRDNILTVKGMNFPKLLPNPMAKTMNCCTVGDTRTVVAIPRFRIERDAVFPKGKVTYKDTTPYSPPLTCWVISSYNLETLSERRASYIVTAVPGGYSFVTSGQYQQTFEDVKNLVLNLKILDKFKVDIIANLRQFTNNYASYAQSMSVSHGSLLLKIELTSAGLTKGRSWYEGIVTSTETCCPPEITNPVELRTALTTWVNNTVNALPNKGRGPGRTFNYGDIIGVPIDQKDMKGYVLTPGATPSPTPR